MGVLAQYMTLTTNPKRPFSNKGAKKIHKQRKQRDAKVRIQRQKVFYSKDFVDWMWKQRAAEADSAAFKTARSYLDAYIEKFPACMSQN